MKNQNDVINPFSKGTSGMSWFFEQQLYMPYGIVRAVKAGEGSGNIPKVIVNVERNKIYNGRK